MDDISGFDFTGADFRGSDLSRVRGLDRAILTGARTDAATRWPSLPEEIRQASFDAPHNVASRTPNPSVERARAALLAAGHDGFIIELPAGTRTAADAAQAIGCTVAQIAKSVVFRSGRNRPVIVIASGANRVDAKKVQAKLHVPIDRAEADFVRDTTDFALGGVQLRNFAVSMLVRLLDEDLYYSDRVWAAAGSPSHMFMTDGRMLMKLLDDALVANVRA